ncbi:hypothetical protein [Mucilaginibacter sp.]|uniref:hypothetical protein n=1 Tax=Mucilaginibacter sp. TaxID=1882438 RepID=UPI0032650E15
MSDYLPIIGAFCVGLAAIYQNKIKAKFSESWLNWLLIIFLLISTCWSFYSKNQDNGKLAKAERQSRKDSLQLQKNFKGIQDSLETKNKELTLKTDQLRDQLDRRTEDLADKLKNAGNDFVRNIKKSSDEVKNQLSDEKRYAFLYLTTIGYNHYAWQVVNPFREPVFMTSLIKVNYDELMNCKNELRTGGVKIDARCFLNATQGDTTVDGSTRVVAYGGYYDHNLTFDRSQGLHRIEVQYKLRNRVYFQQIVYEFGPDRGLHQSTRLITNQSPFKIILLKKSADINFNRKINFDKLFPLPMERTYYGI